MIDSTTLPLARFDLKGFIKGYCDFYRQWSDDDSLAYFITGVEKHGDVPGNFLPDDAKDEEAAILASLKDGLKVFFMMHEPAADDRFRCIDGKSRGSEDLDINLEDGYGFLVEIEGDSVHLHPALYDGSDDPPALTLQGTCSVMEKPMKQFLDRFIKQ